MNSKQIAARWLAAFMALERKKFIESLKRTAEVNRRYSQANARAKKAP